MKTLIFALCLFMGGIAYADIDTERLADAIYKAEGGMRAVKPYGVLKDYCKRGDPDGQCRKGCIQTIEKWRKRLTYKDDKDFIKQFGSVYAPLNADNDPTGLNHNWVKNVTALYKKGGTK